MRRFFAQNGLLRREPSMILGHCGVVFARRVDIRMAQNIRDKVNITGFPVQIRTKGAPQFVRADLFFERRSNGGVFLDHVFDRTLRNAPALNGQKEGVLMAGERLNLPALFEIILERLCNLIRQVEDDILAAFSCDDKGVLLKIKVVDIQANAFADTNTRTQKQGQYG